MDKYKVHVVPHMHWDREWYFSTEESRILLVNNMEEIMSRLESDPSYKNYLLDGQTAILEDFLDVKPNEKKRIKKLVEEGRLILGPWYTQTDSIVVGGESIVRNLFYGIKDSREYGDYMKIGYLPDSFGQSEQLPQIFSGVGIEKSVFWRGCSERHGTDKTEFYWESPNGSKTLNQILPLGYAIGKYLPGDEEGLKKRLDTYLDVLKGGATSEHLILPHGHDQMPLQKNIMDVVDKLNNIYDGFEFFISDYDSVFKGIESDDLDTISGEFIDGKYMRVHRSISSTRMDIKDIHGKLESKITGVLEPLSAIAKGLGFEYHHGLIELIWKLILKNHAHDSIGCCCSDKVHREILERFLLADEKVDALITHYKRKIADHSKDIDGMDKIVLFNTLPREKNDNFRVVVRTRAKGFNLKDSSLEDMKYKVLSKKVIDPGLIDRQIVHYGEYNPFNEYLIEFSTKIAPMGYKGFYLEEKIEEVEVEEKVEKKYIENEFFKVEIDNDGRIDLLNKKSNKIYSDIFDIEDGSDNGDEYDYAPLEEKYEWVLTKRDIKDVEIKCLKEGSREKAILKFKMDIPKDLEERKNKGKSVVNTYEMEISLSEGKETIDTSIKIDNKGRDHRVRVIFNTGIDGDYTVADEQFGSIKRKLRDDAMDVWEKEGWKEMPIGTYSMMNVVGVEDDKGSFNLITNGIREYEGLKDNSETRLALTIFRSVGVLGKEELLTRPGRPSGIKLPTPDSQMIGEYTFEYGVYISDRKVVESGALKVAKEYVCSYETYNKIPYNAMKLNLEDIATPDEYSLFKIDGEGVLSTVKYSEDNKFLVVRVFNPYRDKKIDMDITFNVDVKEVFLGNLLEEVEEKVEVEKNKVTLKEIGYCEFKTLLIKL